MRMEEVHLPEPPERHEVLRDELKGVETGEELRTDLPDRLYMEATPHELTLESFDVGGDAAVLIERTEDAYCDHETVKLAFGSTSENEAQ